MKRAAARTGIRPPALLRSHDRSRGSPPTLGPRTEPTWLSGPGVDRFLQASSRTITHGKARATTTGGTSHNTGADCQRMLGAMPRRRVRSPGVDEFPMRRSDVGSGRMMRAPSPSHATTVTHGTSVRRFAPLFDEEHGLRTRGGHGCFTRNSDFLLAQKRSAHVGLAADAVVPPQATNGERMTNNRHFASRAARKSSPPEAHGGQLQAIADMHPRPDYAVATRSPRSDTVADAPHSAHVGVVISTHNHKLHSPTHSDYGHRQRMRTQLTTCHTATFHVKHQLQAAFVRDAIGGAIQQR